MNFIAKFFHSHRFLERKRVEVEINKGWYRVDRVSGDKIPNSSFAKGKYLVVEECGHPDCNVQRCFEIVQIIGGADDGTIETKKEIHPDMAKEKIFVESL
jgi:hypothetical protein